MIINAFQVDYTSEKVKELCWYLQRRYYYRFILLAAVWGAGKVLKLNEVEATSIYYSNSGNLIVPLVTFYSGKRMGIIWLCVHECPTGISVDTWQEYDQPGRKAGLEKDCL